MSADISGHVALSSDFRTREGDIKQLKEQKEQMRVMDSEYQGLRLLLQSYQEGRADLEAEAR